MALDAGPLSIGDNREQVLVDGLSRTQIVMYAGASGDYNPLHTDEVFATKVGGYPSVFAHGMLTMGMTARVLTDWVGVGRLLSYGARLLKPVWPGDTLVARAEVTGMGTEAGRRTADFAVVTRNQHGETVLAGTARALVELAPGG
jgi:acyl dehydratase